QTPDTRHEENLVWLAMLSFSMLYQVRRLATEATYPWERRKVKDDIGYLLLFLRFSGSFFSAKFIFHSF
ncbi:MAG: hypothetical protein ACRENT_01025, partial [Thermodesulfobacteriota bacterium]